MMRGSYAPVTWPKLLDLKFVLIPPSAAFPINCVWFHTLKNSARNWRLLPRSWLNQKFLKTERFQLSRPGPRTEPRGVFPHVPAAGAVYMDVSNHSVTVCGSLPLPPTSGRFDVFGTRLVTLFPFKPMLSGAPD